MRPANPEAVATPEMPASVSSSNRSTSCSVCSWPGFQAGRKLSSIP